jgi:hypothetical protein
MPSNPPISTRHGTAHRVKRIHKIHKSLSSVGLRSKSFFKQMPLLVAAPNVPFSVTIALIMNGHSLTDIYQYCMPREPLADSLMSVDTRQEHAQSLKERIQWMMTEQRCRHLFRRVVQCWLYKKYSKNYMNTEDPATLLPPRNPIHLYRPAMRGSWAFEANSLFKCIKKDLGVADWLFPYPKHPRNPFTNTAFTHLECDYLFNQLRSKLYTHWKLEGYTTCAYSTKVFSDVFRTPLKLAALADLLTHPEDETLMELLIDFIDDQMYTQNYTAPHRFPILRWAVRNRPRHPYIEQWRSVFAAYTRYQLLYGDEYILITPPIREKLYKEIRELFDDTDSIAELSLEKINQTIEKERAIHQNALRELLTALNLPQEPSAPIPNVIVLPFPNPQLDDDQADSP